jgi:hypothetical protein
VLLPAGVALVDGAVALEPLLVEVLELPVLELCVLDDWECCGAGVMLPETLGVLWCRKNTSQIRAHAIVATIMNQRMIQSTRRKTG